MKVRKTNQTKKTHFIASLNYFPSPGSASLGNSGLFLLLFAGEQMPLNKSMWILDLYNPRASELVVTGANYGT